MRLLFSILALAMLSCLGVAAQAQGLPQDAQWEQCPPIETLVIQDNALGRRWVPAPDWAAKGWYHDFAYTPPPRSKRVEWLGSMFMRATLYASQSQYKMVCYYEMRGASVTSHYLSLKHARGGAGNRFQMEGMANWDLRPAVQQLDAQAIAACSGNAQEVGGTTRCRWNWQRAHAAQTY